MKVLNKGFCVLVGSGLLLSQTMAETVDQTPSDVQDQKDKIAVLGYGSLIEDWGDIPLASVPGSHTPFLKQGPTFKIDYGRISGLCKNGKCHTFEEVYQQSDKFKSIRMSVVILNKTKGKLLYQEKTKRTQIYYATYDNASDIRFKDNYDQARYDLAEREGTSKLINIPGMYVNRQGQWQYDARSINLFDEDKQMIKEWAKEHDFRGVIWTQFEYNFAQKMPQGHQTYNKDNVVYFFQQLKDHNQPSFDTASDYVLNVPPEINNNTQYDVKAIVKNLSAKQSNDKRMAKQIE